MTLEPIEVALGKLLDGATPVRETETVPLGELAGRIAAGAVVARRTQPAFAASAMDGYAVRAADLEAAPRDLTLVGQSAAGSAFAGTVQTGQAVRIFTGAPVPDGADTVVIQENTSSPGEGSIRVDVSPQRGANIRPAGNDFSSGDVLVRSGTRIRAASIALIGAGGYAQATVLRRPRVAIAGTGDELVAPGEPVGDWQIVGSNGYGVAAIAQAAGAEVIDLGLVRDTEAAIGDAIDRAVDAGADILVTIGGASVGDLDLVAPVLRSKGATLDFWRIAMRPGKPLMAGRLGTMRFLGLPGNPASSLTSTELFLVPLVERMAGRPARDRMRGGRLGASVPANDHRAEFMRATVRRSDDETVVMPLPRQDSSLLTIFAEADALLYRPPHAPAGEVGDACRYLELD